MCTALSNIMSLGYNHDVADDIKGQVLFFIPVSRPVYLSTVLMSIVIALVTVMKGKQARLMTVAPWEFGTEKVCVCDVKRCYET